MKKNEFLANFIWSFADYLEKENKSIDSLIDEKVLNASLKMLISFRQTRDSNTFFPNLNLKNFSYCLNKTNLKLVNLYSEDFKEYHLEAVAQSLYCDVITLNFLKYF